MLNFKSCVGVRGIELYVWKAWETHVSKIFFLYRDGIIVGLVLEFFSQEIK